MNRKELHRPGLLKAVCAGRISNRHAATALRLSVRQVQRLKRRFEAGGASALRHGNRGRPSPRRLPAAVRDQVGRLMRTTYLGFNDSHLTEKLRETSMSANCSTVASLRSTMGSSGVRPLRPARASS